MNRLSIIGLIFLVLFFSGCGRFFPEETEADLILDGPIVGLTLAQKATFAAGDEAFGDIFSPKMGLGPVFNMPSCASCHVGDGKGHPATNLTRFGRRLGDGSFDYMEDYGGPQLQDRSIPGYPAEVLPSAATGVSVRSAPIVAGIGFLEAVPDSTLLSLADPDDSDGDGISGRVNYVTPPEFFSPKPHHLPNGMKFLGRFGRKATTIDLLHQTAGAYIDDMGITSDFFTTDLHNPAAGQFSGDGVADPEVGSATVSNVVFYLRTLKPPAPRHEDDSDVLAGKALFSEIGCVDCHIVELRTGDSDIEVLSNKKFYPYTDMLLHDMGDELADNYPEGSATGSEWRTTPLWGLGLIKETLGGVPYYLHDGRNSDLREVIRLHGGEGAHSRANFQELDEEAQVQIIRFLESL
ncbi:MAG TPA: thiol oxidoreductase [Candidatus Marinimicrobia bacterium]|nr:thiol oxidoreductase [Candidatus Neomarinimicrobiota bacterium]